jgi:[ribosomal protein S5]-alanine N-acetyltransferase
MKAPDEIETTRLVLRRPAMSDAGAVFRAYASDPEVTRFLGWPRHRSVHDTRAFLRFSSQEWKCWPAGPYLILLRGDRRLVGSTGLGFQTRDTAVTGYVLARDAWGHGYATEALAAMVDLAPSIGVARLFALCHPDHHPSQHVLEKCGFVLEPAASRPVEFPNLPGSQQQPALCYALALGVGSAAGRAADL